MLKIEIQCLKKQYLNVINMPIIFKTTAGLTTKTDIVMIRNMVSSCMKNSRVVILRIIPANINIVTKNMLEMAKNMI